MHSSLTRTSLTVALALMSLVGCYGTAPHIPDPILLPTYDERAKITIEEEFNTHPQEKQREIVSCPPGHNSSSSRCARSTYTETITVTDHFYLPSYNGVSLGQGQLVAMSVANWRKHEAEARALAERCQQAGTIGRAAAIATTAGLAVGVIGYPVAASLGADPILQWTTIGAAATLLVGGSAAYGAGYFAFGGNSCEAAAEAVRPWASAKAVERNIKIDAKHFDVKAAIASVEQGKGLPGSEWEIAAP